MKKAVRTTLKNILVFAVISAWLLTGWPAIWIAPNFRFPPEIKKVQAASITIFIKATTDPWTVPADWSNTNTIEVIGGGGAGAQGGTNKSGGGGGAGAYTKATNVTTITPGSTVRAEVGLGGTTTGTAGGDTFFCKATGANCTVISGSDVVSGAKGGNGGTISGNTTLSTNAAGGDSASCTGFGTPLCYSGGAGGAGHGNGDTGGGGGGAAGKTGIGKAGGDGNSATTGGAGGGGGANAGSSTAGTAGQTTTGGAGGHGPTTAAGGTAGNGNAGGAGTLGAGGGGGDYNGFSGGAGGPGEVEWTQTSPSETAGAGGGGGGNADSSTSSTNDAGLYGGGGGGGSHSGFGAGADGIIVITYTQDATAPTPNPMTFSTAPNNDAGGQIAMTASQATDENVAQSAISYLFTNDNTSCTYAGTGGTSSSWQLNNLNYTDTGLDPNKCYGYKVQAKDTAGNTTSGETVVATYSSAAIPLAPTVGSPTISTLAVTNNENGNPAANPTTLFAAKISSTTPADAAWLGKWIDAAGNAAVSEVWLTDAQLTETINGLQPSTTYGVQVKAKNQDGDITSLGAEGTGTTLSGNTAPTTPTLLYANERASGAQSGALSPVVALGDSTPVFSAVYNDPDAGNVASYYEMIVYSDACSTQVWDSGQTALTSCDVGNRCQDITFGGTALPFDGATYYWKIKYWDSGGLAGSYSNCADTFAQLGPGNQLRHGNYFFNNTAKRVYTW